MRFRQFCAIPFAILTLTTLTVTVSGQQVQGLGSDLYDTGGLDLRSVHIGRTLTVDVSDESFLEPRVVGPDSDLSGSAQFRLRTISVVRIDYRQGGDDRICSGIAIDRGKILTAGHCACGEPLSYRVTRWTTDLTPEELTLSALPIRFHDETCRVSGRIVPGFDLALLLLRDLREFSARLIIPVTHMVHVYQDTEVERLTVMGFGLTDQAVIPDFALAGHVNIGSHFCSQEPFDCARFQEFILADGFDRDGTAPTDTCGGDSGGPVFYSRVSGERADLQELLLVGITSRAINTTGNANALGCGGGGIYTAVGRSDVLRWLDTHGVQYGRRTFEARSR